MTATLPPGVHPHARSVSHGAAGATTSWSQLPSKQQRRQPLRARRLRPVRRQRWHRSSLCPVSNHREWVWSPLPSWRQPRPPQQRQRRRRSPPPRGRLTSQPRLTPERVHRLWRPLYRPLSEPPSLPGDGLFRSTGLGAPGLGPLRRPAALRRSFPPAWIWTPCRTSEGQRAPQRIHGVGASPRAASGCRA